MPLFPGKREGPASRRIREPGDLPERRFAHPSREGVGPVVRLHEPRPLPQRSGFFRGKQGMRVETGLIQVYTGEGKGKTTAALGLVVRALGQGLRVLLVRFLKAEQPAGGEVRFLENSPGLEILTAGVGGIRQGRDRELLRRSVTETFAEVKGRLARQSYDLVVLDEINGALHRELLDAQEFLQFLDARPPGTELVLTGRNALPEVIERAHLVSRVDKVKHPFDRGIGARRGMEF